MRAHDVIRAIDADPHLNTVIRDVLRETRDNITERGRDAELCALYSLNVELARIDPQTLASMLTVMTVRWAQTLPLVEQYAQAVSENTLLLSQGKLDEAHESAQRARNLLAVISLMEDS